MNMFPLASFDVIDERRADAALVEWGHYLGECERPYGVQSFGLEIAGELVSVAVSASTAGVTAGGWPRRKVVELARLATKPGHQWATRVTLRLWRELAPACWAKYWPVDALVSYSDTTRHKGDIYRFDGWVKVAEVRGSTGGGTYSTVKKATPKAVWVYVLPRLLDNNAAPPVESPTKEALHGEETDARGE